MRVMVLAAGRGERLRPLTDAVPKAMVVAGGKPLIAWHLERLCAAGYREAVINVSHLGERIVEHLGDGARYGLRVTYSREPEPLETAGGIAQARALLGEAPFLLVNADIYCEFDFAALRRVSLGTRLVHLVLVPNPQHRSGGDFTLDEGMIGNGAGARYTYAGIAVMSPALVAGVKPGEKAPLAPLLRAAAERRLASGELYRGVWQDVGTRERLAELEAHLASRSTE
jgi:N-acetyl-alpha-D-muramate 1-phosphate uridylyltransferase